jgi:hypothetical protein
MIGIEDWEMEKRLIAAHHQSGSQASRDTYVRQSIQISAKDLIVRSGGPTDFENCAEHLLGIVASSIVESNDCGGTGAHDAAEAICEDNPELRQCYGQQYIEAVAQSLLGADIVSLSAQYTQRFAEFNSRYFGNQLPKYEVRVVFDLHTVANEPVYGGSVSGGLIRFEERFIYIRYTNDHLMIETLVHEMVHAATSGEHDDRWLEEMKRLHESGAPVADCEFAAEARSRFTHWRRGLTEPVTPQSRLASR